LRYFKPIRIEIYRRMLEWIRKHGGQVPIYVCMERPEVLAKAFGPHYLSDKALGDYLVQLQTSDR